MQFSKRRVPTSSYRLISFNSVWISTLNDWKISHGWIQEARLIVDSSGLHSEGAGFRSRSEHCLFPVRLPVDILTACRQIPATFTGLHIVYGYYSRLEFNRHRKLCLKKSLTLSLCKHFLFRPKLSSSGAVDKIMQILYWNCRKY